MNITDNRPPDPVGRDTGLIHLLQQIWTRPVTTKSDDARIFADEIAEGASRQLLTTAVVPAGAGIIYGRLWKLTPLGLAFLWDHAEELTFEDSRYIQGYVNIASVEKD